MLDPPVHHVSPSVPPPTLGLGAVAAAPPPAIVERCAEDSEGIKVGVDLKVEGRLGFVGSNLGMPEAPVDM